MTTLKRFEKLMVKGEAKNVKNTREENMCQADFTIILILNEVLVSIKTFDRK